ncbi:hypothetical protein [Nonomuraea fuscirosea]|uniref:AbiTii domain-containing protein n=1 Tax=Nonomuraea fuscirosea TaxID=1291556 RepID=UPI0015E63B1E|nr:hypothetical protein [Nonomuraea fuscirosea]
MSSAPSAPENGASLLDRIEDAALNPNVPLSDALRACIALGGRAGSAALREWAGRELNGYTGKKDLPDYRIVPASLYVDHTNLGGFNRMPQRVSPQMLRRDLPEGVREVIDEEVRLPDPIRTLEGHANGHEDDLRFTFGNSEMVAQFLTRLWQQQGAIASNQVVAAIYWKLPRPVLLGVLDRIRTALVVLVAELREATPTGQEVPSPTDTDNALKKAVGDIKIDGDHNVVTVQMSDSGDITAKIKDSPDNEGEATNRKVWSLVGWGIGILVAIVGAYAGLGQWLNWPAPW